MKRRLRGFTLTELMVTMVILAILMAVVVPAYQEFMDISDKKRAEANGKEVYMAAATAVDTTYAMHNSEFRTAMNKQITYKGVDENGNPVELKSQFYGRITSSGLFSVQNGKGGFNYITGYENFASNGKGKNVQGVQYGDALIAKYFLKNLHALNKDPGKIEPRFRFFYDLRPSDNNMKKVLDYDTKVRNKGNYKGYPSRQAGIIIIYGIREGHPGEIIYTEYGDSDGYLVICINPAWYKTIKNQLVEVKNRPLSEEDEAACCQRDASDPIVYVIKNGTYEAPNMK